MKAPRNGVRAAQLLLTMVALLSPLPTDAATKGHCQQAGGRVIESGIAGWWFCCTDDVCLSCTGEGGTSDLRSNCEVMIHACRVAPEPKAKTATITVVLPVREEIEIPFQIWMKLSPAYQNELLMKPVPSPAHKLPAPKEVTPQ